MVRVGQGRPLQSQIPKAHHAVISGYIPVSALVSVCCELGRGRHMVGEGKGSHMLAV